MKKLLLGLVSTLIPLLLVAQPYGNEWIDYSLDRYYFKFKVAKDGIYRIDQAALSNAIAKAGASVSISSIDPRTIQVFAKGSEQYIHVEGQGDGSFDNNDYIELYCEKNTGWLDERMYPSASEHTNPYYSLYTDTLVYFLTWNPSGAQSTFRYATIPFGTAASTPMDYFIREQTVNYNTVYHPGADLQGGKPVTRYSGGKGWTKGEIGYNAQSSKGSGEASFQTSNVFGSADAKIQMGIMGYNAGAGGAKAHHARIQHNPNGVYTTLEDLILSEYEFKHYQTTFASSLITATTHKVRPYVTSTGSLVDATVDYVSLSYQKFSYPHTMSFSGESIIESKIRVPQSAVDVHFNTTSWPGGTTSYLYDPKAGRRYELQQSGTTLKCNIVSGIERDLYLAANSAVVNIGLQGLSPVSDDGQFQNPLDLQRDSAFLIITNKKLKASAAEYASYRNSTHNGSAVVVYVDELYDQFAYGISLHPLAIRGFCGFAIDNWNTEPKFLLLLGKTYQESEHRKDPIKRSNSLVPTMCYPPSDNYLTMGLADHPYAPALATGRIAAQNDTEVRNYKTKLNAMERSINDFSATYTIDQKQWQKNILHFAGGNDASENQYFKNNLKSYQTSLQGPQFGGKIFLFSKTTSNVIEQLDLDTIRELIASGVSMMCFFGHGTTNNGFDINVDDPADWNNYEKYPIVMANSCYSGNIHTDESTSERYVLLSNEGAIAFVATPDLSLPDDLNDMCYSIHQEISTLHYGKSLGEQIRNATYAVSPKTINNPNNAAEVLAVEKNRSIALEMTLHGDPALRVYPHSKSELSINDPVKGPAYKLEPSFITTDIDSFDIIVDVTNLGRAVSGITSLRATRELPTSTGTDIRYRTIENLGYAQSVRFRFPVDPINGVGPNDITIEVDYPESVIPEFDESNNNVIQSITVDVVDANISPVYPYNFGVVPDMNVTLKANTGYPFAKSRTYTIQIDTTDLYLNPLQQQVTQSGAVIEWTPNLPSFGFKDSTVFFWRVAPSEDLSKWKEFSFQVIKGQFGWGQDHFFQFKNNDFDFLNYDRSKRKLSFNEATRELTVHVVGSANPAIASERDATEYRLDGQLKPLGEYGLPPNSPPSMAIAIIDTTNLLPWGTYGLENGVLINQNHRFGNSNDYDPSTSRGARVEYWFSFNLQTQAGRDNMIDLIENEVPDGYYILAYSLRVANFETLWNDTMFQAFENLGADSIRYVENQNPYIFFTKKGSPELTEEVIGTYDRDIIDFKTKVYSTLKQGTISGPEIGPALEWGTFHMKKRSLESNTTDVVKATAIGLNNQGFESNEAELNASGQIDLQIDADSIPNMRLEFFTSDNTKSTPAQLDNWHVLYGPAPDVAINPINGLIWTEKTLTAGEPFHFGVSIDNISEFDFDSLYVRYWVTAKGGEVISEKILGYAGLKAGASLLDSVPINTSSLDGRYTQWIEVNPRDYRWHKEQYHFNNRAYLPFKVTGDNNNPLLDVTFDGIHILNGDIVSPIPEIVMELKDENQYLLLDDTTSFDVFMTYPSGAQKRIPFVRQGKEVMAFEPATNKKNKARVTYSPEQLEDGTHKLSVMGRDASGNSSGKKAYEIEFEVINKSTVTQVMNYPNPFTTSTRFVFTLTGMRVPDVFTIQILSVTGKVVREITKDELGPINIGRNITQYAWNGTDEFGDRLANGVYLYRVIMKIDGQAIERMESGADQYFTKEFGKMYLFR